MLFPMTKRIFLSLPVLCLALGGAVAACSSESSDSADSGESSEKLTIYSGRDEELIGPLLDTFTEETGIEVDVRYGESADLALLIDQEGDRTPADMFISQSPGAMGHLDANDRLTPLPQDVLDAVPVGYRGPDGDWVGLTGRVRVLVYNTELVTAEELPSSVFDLTAEQYRDQVGVAPTNGSFQDFVSVMREEVGDASTLEWLEGLKDNGARTYDSNSAIVEAVGRGEVAMGLVNHYYNERAKAENPDVASENFFFADGDVGTVILVTAAGIIEGTDAKDNAERLLEFLVSEPAQEYFAVETFEYPLAPGVEPASDLPALDTIVTPPEDLAALGRDLAATKALIEESGLEQA